MRTLLKTLVAITIIGLYGTCTRAAYYLVGSMNDWNPRVNEYELKPVGNNGVYMIELDCLNKGDKFRITDGNGYNENSFGYPSSDKDFTFEKNYDIKKGESLNSIRCPFTIYNVTLYLHPNEPYIYVTGTPAPYLIGDWDQGGTKWDFDSGVELQPTDESLKNWYGKVYMNRSGESSFNYFRFKEGNTQYGPESTTDHRDVEMDNVEQTATKTESRNRSFITNEADYYFITYTKGDGNAAPTFVISRRPSTLYLYGDLRGDDWKQDDYYSAVDNDGVYEFKNVYIKGNRDDKDVNYIAFFSSVDSAPDGGVNYSTMYPRFGGDTTEQAADNNTNIVIEPGSEFPVSKKLTKYNESASRDKEHNFQLPEGLYDITADLKNGTVTFAKSEIRYTVRDVAQPWSKSGMTYGGVVTIESGEMEINPDDITVIFEKGPEGEWLEGDSRPEGIEDAEWNEWTLIEADGQLVDGYWDASKVSAEITSEGDNFTISAILPCSGKYSVKLTSDNYNLVAQEEMTLTAYPSVRNIWAVDAYRNDENKYIPLCLNINGITMNTASGQDAFDGWYMSYPFLAAEDENVKVIWNHGQLHMSVLYTPGVYFADKWIMAAETSAEPEPAPSALRSAKRPAGIPEGYTKGNLLNLSKMATEDGTGVGSNYQVSVILSKNGATTPVIGDGEQALSEESFIVSPSLTAPIPTGVEAAVAETGEATYYTLQGVRVLNPGHGIYIRVANGKASKILI